MKRSLLVGVFVIALSTRAAVAGHVDIGTPIVSGESFRIESSHASLSETQVQQVSLWLEQHRSEWHGMITEATNEPITLTVRLKHVDGSFTMLSIIARSTGGHYMRLQGPGKWTYKSFGGIFKSWAAEQPLSDQELAALQSIVDVSGLSHNGPQRTCQPRVINRLGFILRSRLSAHQPRRN